MVHHASLHVYCDGNSVFGVGLYMGEVSMCFVHCCFMLTFCYVIYTHTSKPTKQFSCTLLATEYKSTEYMFL